MQVQYVGFMPKKTSKKAQNAIFSIYVFQKLRITSWIITQATINIFPYFFFMGYRRKFRRIFELGLQNFLEA